MRRTLRFLTATLLAVHMGCGAAQAAITPVGGLMPADSYLQQFIAVPGNGGSFDMLAVVWSPTSDYRNGEFEVARLSQPGILAEHADQPLTKLERRYCRGAGRFGDEGLKFRFILPTSFGPRR